MVVSTAYELCFGVSGQISMPLWGLQISASAGGAYSQVPIIISLSAPYSVTSSFRSGFTSLLECPAKGFVRPT